MKRGMRPAGADLHRRAEGFCLDPVSEGFQAGD